MSSPPHNRPCRARGRCARRLFRAPPELLVTAIVCVVVAGLLSACGGVGDTRNLADRFGFNEPPTPANDKLQSEIGARIRRWSVGWNLVEPTPGQWDWSQIDAQYASMIAAGLRPLIVAGSAPCWAHPSVACSGNGAAPPDPTYDAAWSAYISRLASRYHGAAGIEVWNEENLAPNFPPAADPVRYTRLLQEAYRAVKSVDKRLPVISGGLFASPISGSYGMGDGQFLAAMYAAGAKGFMDGIGVHAYPVAGGSDGTPVRYDVRAIQLTLSRIRPVRNAARDASTPIWITETGVSTAPGPASSPPPATPAVQAAYLLAIVRQANTLPDVRVVIFHRLIDQPLTLGESGFGVFRSDDVPKPAACVLRVVFSGPLGCER